MTMEDHVGDSWKMVPASAARHRTPSSAARPAVRLASFGATNEHASLCNSVKYGYGNCNNPVCRYWHPKEAGAVVGNGRVYKLRPLHHPDHPHFRGIVVCRGGDECKGLQCKFAHPDPAEDNVAATAARVYESHVRWLQAHLASTNELARCRFCNRDVFDRYLPSHEGYCFGAGAHAHAHAYEDRSSCGGLDQLLPAENQGHPAPPPASVWADGSSTPGSTHALQAPARGSPDTVVAKPALPAWAPLTALSSPALTNDASRPRESSVATLDVSRVDTAPSKSTSTIERAMFALRAFCGEELRKAKEELSGIEEEERRLGEALNAVPLHLLPGDVLQTVEEAAKELAARKAEVTGRITQLAQAHA